MTGMLLFSLCRENRVDILFPCSDIFFKVISFNLIGKLEFVVDSTSLLLYVRVYIVMISLFVY